MTGEQYAGRRIVQISMVAVTVALLLLIHVASPPATGLWTKILINSLHVPAFGVIALCVFVLAGASGNVSPRHRAGMAIAIAIALGALSEAVQIPGPRHASIEDLRSDWLGATGTVLLAVAITGAGSISRQARAAVGLAGTVALVFALLPLISISAAYLERNLRAPEIVAFDSRFGHRFRLAQNAALRVARDAAGARPTGRITLKDGPWPGIIFHDVWPDWRGYSSLVVELGLDGDTPLELNIRVHDRPHLAGDQPYRDRFNMTYELKPGSHAVRVPLERILNAPVGRQMDLSRIDGVVIFCGRGNAGRTFELASVRLD